MTTIIYGDIGGTNCRLNLSEYSSGSILEIKSETIPSHDHKSFCEIISMFLQGQPTPVYGVFAIAGVTTGDSARFVNMGWGGEVEFSESAEKTLGIGKIVFLNDFEAAGYGCLQADPSDYVQINPGVSPVPEKRVVVMGPGTGLGECILTFSEGRYSSWPGEGGHSDFAPHDEEQWRFARFMMGLMQNNEEYSHFRPCEGVSQEACIAGVGAFHIYDFYKSEYPELVDPAFEQSWERFARFKEEGIQDERIRLMMEHGFRGDNELCKKSVELWMKLLAYECGNLISKSLPFSGLYLIGGLVTKNYDAFLAKSEYFKRHLLTKPKHICEVIEKVPFYVVRNPDVGMLGTIWYMKNVLKIT